MKRALMPVALGNVIAKRAFLAVLLTGAVFFTASAQQTVSETTAPKASVYYVGISDNMKVFNLKCDNTAGDKLEVAVYNANGDRLYAGTYTDEKLSKTFKTPSDIGDLYFVVRNNRTNDVQKFEVSTETKMVEEVVVTKVR